MYSSIIHMLHVMRHFHYLFQYYFEASIDGVIFFNKTENENPTAFERVSVFAGLLEPLKPSRQRN